MTDFNRRTRVDLSFTEDNAMKSVNRADFNNRFTLKMSSIGMLAMLENGDDPYFPGEEFTCVCIATERLHRVYP